MGTGFQSGRSRAHLWPPSPLAIRRLELGLSQADVAAAAGIYREHLSRLELGKRQPRPQTAEALARALQCDPADLFPPARSGR